MKNLARRDFLRTASLATCCLAFATSGPSLAQFSQRELVITDDSYGPASFVGDRLDLPDGYTVYDIQAVGLVYDDLRNTYEAEFVLDPRHPNPGTPPIPRQDDPPPRIIPVERAPQVETETSVEVTINLVVVKLKISYRRKKTP